MGLKPSVTPGGLVHCSLYGNITICYALSKVTQNMIVCVYLSSIIMRVLYNCTSSPGQAQRLWRSAVLLWMGRGSRNQSLYKA